MAGLTLCFKNIWTFDEQIQNTLGIETSSCLCSTILIGQREEILQNVFRIPGRSRITQKGFRADTGHSSAQEKKQHGMERTLRGISALNRGVLKRQGGRCTIHFTAESSNAGVFFRTIHSANELNIFGAAASWCDVAQLIPGQTHMIMDKSVAKESYRLSQRLELWYRHQGGAMRPRETACVFTFESLKSW